MQFYHVLDVEITAYTTKTMDLVEELKKGSKELNSEQIILNNTEKVYSAVLS